MKLLGFFGITLFAFIFVQAAVLDGGLTFGKLLIYIITSIFWAGFIHYLTGWKKL